MTDPYFKKVFVSEVGDDVLSLVDKACQESYHGHSLKDVMPSLLIGDMQLWYGNDFVVLTTILQHPAHRELSIWAIAGVGYIKAVDEVVTALRQFGKDNDCKIISAMTSRKAFDKVVARFGAVTEFKYKIVEIS